MARETMKKAVAAAVVAAGLCATGASHAAGVNLLVNGSFETGPSVSDFVQVNSPSTAITGWTVSAGSVDYIGSYWTAKDGTKSIDLNGAVAGTLSQSVSLVKDQQYELGFWLAGNAAGGPAVKTLDVLLGSDVLKSFSFDTAGKTLGDLGWVWATVGFTAKSTGPFDLSFKSTTTAYSDNSTWPYAFGPVVDGAHLSAVPLPAAAWLFGSAVLGLGLLARRRVQA